MTKTDKNVIAYSLLALALLVALTVAAIIHTQTAPRTAPQQFAACTQEVGTITGQLVLSEDRGSVRGVTYAGATEWYTLIHLGEC